MILIAAVSLGSCSGGGATQQAEDSSGVVVDTVYVKATAESLIEKSKSEGQLSQADYAAMIEQCRAICRILAEKISSVEFKEDMTDSEINAAMERLQADKELPELERQSREMLVVLQNADLDKANMARYDRMVSDVETALRSH